VPVALTTQTGGSTIRPAAYCGIVGYKPPFGQVPTDGLHLLAPSLDVIGLHARNVADIARVAAVMEARALPLDNRSPPCFGLLSLTGATINPLMRAPLDAAIGTLRAAGAKVLVLDLPAFDPELDEAHRVIMSVEVARSFSRLAPHGRALLSESLSQFIARGERETSQALADAQACVARAKARLSHYHGVILVGPAAEGEAPVGLASTGSSQLNRPWSLLLTSAITLPCGFGPAGLPLGLQLIDPAPEGLGLLPAAAFAETALLPLSSQPRNAK
jgi:Asp-tRNA(Asn)/Glu-tRNA(Gln) amidotransferase A subunit family amidase